MVAISVILRELDPGILDTALQEMTGGMTDFFDNEFAVIDIGALSAEQDQQIDWPALIALFKSYQLNPVAVRNAPPELSADIIAHGLSLDGGTHAREPNDAAAAAHTKNTEPDQTDHTASSVEADEIAPAPPEPTMQASAPTAPPEAALAPAAPAATLTPITPVPTMIIDTPVRAGQRIYARGCDLIITAVVNNGAEIIADGSIHIYAPLRGRALAGASGNAGARIFALSMEPELVSIAGVYRTFEEGFPAALAHQPAQVRLVGDRIDLLAANAAEKR